MCVVKPVYKKFLPFLTMESFGVYSPNDIYVSIIENFRSQKSKLEKLFDNDYLVAFVPSTGDSAIKTAYKYFLPF